jgi:outer membrane protein assembly factor BamA
VNAGIDSNQTFVSRSVIYMSDMLGDRRFVASLDSVSSFSNFDFLYLDLKHRLNWGARVFDDRAYYLGQDLNNGDTRRARRQYRETGALGLLSYPFDRYHRIDAGAGYVSRQVDYPITDDLGNIAFIGFKDNFPLVTSTFTGDTATYKSFGPIAGRRYSVTGSYAIDTTNHGTLSRDLVVEARQYFPITQRSLIAARVFAAVADGNRPNLYYFGGLNTLRGFDFREFVGTRAAFANFEFRFPLVDLLASPILLFRQIRGEIFFDVGAASFKGQPFRFLQGGQLVDGRASVGYGVSFDFLGLELHFDWAKRTDLKNFDDKYQTTFWIGETF